MAIIDGLSDIVGVNQWEKLERGQSKDDAQTKPDITVPHCPVWPELRSGDGQPGRSSSIESENTLDLDLD